LRVAFFSCVLGLACQGSGVGQVTQTAPETLAGSSTRPDASAAGFLQLVAGSVDGAGAVDGVGASARFADDRVSHTENSPGIASRGNAVYVADMGNQAIRKVEVTGVVTTLAGKFGSRGAADGPGAAARFNDPAGIAIDASGALYVADSSNHTIRKISPAGLVTTLAGTAGLSGAADGAGSRARFNHPQGIAVDQAGNLYVADRSNHAIRRVTPDGVVSTLAGASTRVGQVDGGPGEASFSRPQGVAVDTGGALYVTDRDGSSVRKITPAGSVSTLALVARLASAEQASGAPVHLNDPHGIALDHDSELLVVESGKHRVRRIVASKLVEDVAGDFSRSGAPGKGDGVGFAARFYRPTGIAVSPVGEALVMDAGNATVRALRLSDLGQVTTRAGKARNRFGSGESVDGDAASARFNFERTSSVAAALAVDTHGSVFVAETYSHVIRRVSPSGDVVTLAGKAGVQGSADGPGRDARFSFPTAIAVDRTGTVYVADGANHTIRTIDRAGTVNTMAGAAGVPGSNDGDGPRARFNGPSGIAVDSDGTVYVSDHRNHTVRRIDSLGRVSTWAGKAGVAGSANGPAADARLERPRHLTLDASGNLFVVDGDAAQYVRRVSAEGIVSTPSAAIWRQPRLPKWGAVSLLAYAFGALTHDRAGSLLVVNQTQNTLWKVNPQGSVDVVAGDPDWPGFSLGRAPGRLDQLGGLAMSRNHTLLLTNGNAVLQLSPP
jgi:sugar lactone lactonase YvrE